jgi:hypothetical protein
MKIMVFLHGTVIMHRNAAGRSREERVKQVLDSDESLHDFAAYVPVGDAPGKLQAWSLGGAEIVYLSSHKNIDDAKIDRSVLQTYSFPDGPVFFRHSGEEYHEVAEQVRPDILVEDDCESIGGEKAMTYPHIKPELKAKVKGIVVQEFGGIDHLPDDILTLMKA